MGRSVCFGNLRGKLPYRLHCRQRLGNRIRESRGSFRGSPWRQICEAGTVSASNMQASNDMEEGLCTSMTLSWACLELFTQRYG